MVSPFWNLVCDLFINVCMVGGFCLMFCGYFFERGRRSSLRELQKNCQQAVDYAFVSQCVSLVELRRKYNAPPEVRS